MITWLVWRAIGKQPQVFIVASEILLLTGQTQTYPSLYRGFAKMGRRWMSSIVNRDYERNRVWGGQGSPHGSAPNFGPATTPGSSMNRCASVPAGPGPCTGSCPGPVSEPSSGPSVAGSALSRSSVWIALFALLAVASLSSVPLRAQSANSLYKHGEAAEARED